MKNALRTIALITMLAGGGNFTVSALPAAETPPGGFPGSQSKFHGFDQYDFKLENVACRVVTPQQVASGRPWIWRARFWGHEPQTEIALLKRGFHVAYCDVADLWGNAEAIRRWDRFYAYVTRQHGFSRRPALEGMSRGGLMIYHWAIEHPDQVSCIYGDAPTLGIRPYVRNITQEDDPDLDKLRGWMQAHGLSLAEAKSYQLDTLDRLEPLAEVRVPVIHVCGDADESVPFEQHTAEFARRYKKLGGSIEVIVKKGGKHHPHSLKDPTPIVDFIVRHQTRTDTRRSGTVPPATAKKGLRIAAFSIDITPPLGQPVGQGFIPILENAEHPLLARGIIFQDADQSCVVCTLDLMEVHNDSYDFLRAAIGEAAGVPASHVAMQSLHQHTAPAIDTAAQRFEFPEDHPRRVATADYLVDIAKKLTAAIHESRKHWQKITHIGIGKAQVERVASNRRLERPDGSIQGRSSNTKSSPGLRELPEGLIDPFVRTVSLNDGDRAAVYLHYYASHPQSFYGDGRASYDVPGILRERLEKKTGVFQLYLTGCGGDVAFGKYNDGSREARTELTERLQRGIEQSVASLERMRVEPIEWSVAPLKFPTRSDEAFGEAANRRILDDPNSNAAQRRKAAIALAWIERLQAEPARLGELSCLSIGRVKMLHLPGEPFVQFQLAAQKMRPDRFVCVAGYGDCGMGYIGGDRIYTDRGGYEQTYAFAGPCEKLFLATIKRLLIVDSKDK